MTYYPTRLTHTLIDVAKLGVYWDEYTEKFRGTRYDDSVEQTAYRAAYRVINGTHSKEDAALVREHYEEFVKQSCFTSKGELGAHFKREIYMPKEERRRKDEEAAARLQERRDRQTFEELKKKYGW